MNRRSVLFAPALLLTGCATAQSRPDNAALVKQVTDTELAFAKTMADRDHVQVLDSGELAASTGPVFDPDGKLFARFYSTWRREDSGVWRIVFDDGCNLKCA